ncbi:MAG: bifunctional metallophosphatase/5'-nucleotidase [Desulfobulbaceae bacterium]|nr:bifunctional metallophosphatase/5'-nucleotidase [Desulfobulbaceae bacterium]
MIRKITVHAVLLLAVVLLPGCGAGLRPEASGHGSSGPVEFIILQMNDIYELTPVSGGREGGLARVAAVRKELLVENPNTVTVLGGDLFSPSALGTAMVDGKSLAGRQMVAVMNLLGLDYATFGNHEFDLGERDFLDRLAESGFTWISANVFDRHGRPFPGVVDRKIIELEDGGGRTVRLGLFGLTVPANRKEYVSYADPLETARAMVKALRPEVDVLAALTHLPVDDDIALAAGVPGIDLIVGGHEHENIQLWRGAGFVPVFKADANARTLYVHRLAVDPDSGGITIRSELRRVTDRDRADPTVGAEVERWQEAGFAAFRRQGFDPEQVAAVIPEPLDGLESSVRNRPTNLASLIARSLRAAVPGAELAFYNSGAVRIDDVLPAGPLTQYDIIRILPFGDRICEAVIDGSLLRRVLDQGQKNRGSGGFLQAAGAVRDGQGAWLINGEPLDDNRTYRAAVNDFLLSGREGNLAFFSQSSPLVQSQCIEQSDMRRVFGDYLARQYGRH